MKNPPRRVVAGLDASGKSCVLVDEVVCHEANPAVMSVSNLFTGSIAPVDNAAPLEDGLAPFAMEQLTQPVYSFMHVEYAPGMGREDPGMHYTNTADHFFVIEGEVVLVLESGDVVMRAGDAGICRGVMHGWRNDSSEPARLVTMVLPAQPLPSHGGLK